METSFEKVWKRVKASEPFDDAEKLQGFIRDEQRDAADYIWLARKPAHFLSEGYLSR